MAVNYVKAKKSLGQHFLKDRNIARKIVSGLTFKESSQVLEIGPGMGILTGFLSEIPGIDLKVIEIDPESTEYLKANFPGLGPGIVLDNFLTTDITGLFPGKFSVIGNFPYNISSQIFFKILEHHELIPEIVCMVQKEVAERICHGPGSKTYGILSVLLQAYYHIEYLFTVGENVFIPPPKVKSAVIRLTCRDRQEPGYDEVLFFKIVKTAFNQRRKMLGNALKPICDSVPEEFTTKRAEQLSVEQFLALTRKLKEKPR